MRRAASGDSDDDAADERGRDVVLAEDASEDESASSRSASESESDASEDESESEESELSEEEEGYSSVSG